MLAKLVKPKCKSNTGRQLVNTWVRTNSNQDVISGLEPLNKLLFRVLVSLRLHIFILDFAFTVS
jgi:hypothetical protein